MHVEYAQLPPPEDSADRIFVTDNAVIVLDGATAFAPVPVSAQTYADHLGRRLVDVLTHGPGLALTDALSEAIRQTATALKLTPGHSPSSTVSIVREHADGYDMLVLGDSAIIWGNDTTFHFLIDKRLDELRLLERAEYRARLRSGHGFDNRHRQLLKQLQVCQAQFRNKEKKYWIAEADPNAAYRSLTNVVKKEEARWLLLMTDGVHDLLPSLEIQDWLKVATSTAAELAQQLNKIYDWETATDPDGIICPRAKRHDDKLVAAVATVRQIPQPLHNTWQEQPSS